MIRLVGILTASTMLSLLAFDVSAVEDQPTFPPEQIEFFETHIRPLFVEHCYDCHSTDAKELKADLYVDGRAGILKGGDSGPAIVVQKPAESLLISAVKYESSEMPPDRKLSDKQIQALEKWVEMGAPWPHVTTSPGIADATEEIDWDEAKSSHWAWRPVERPEVPDSYPGDNHAMSVGIAQNAIDHFVTAKRTEAGVMPVGMASPHTLARRIYVDLIGVLPTPVQVNQFKAAVAIDRQTAVAELVDALLNSPQYGERWARHWLDVARYSDGRGGFLDGKALDQAWRYRDWVVTALNDDMPIDEFIRLQIAGDLLGDRDDAIATGFFALGPTYNSDGGDPDSIAQAKGETLDDRIDTLTRGLLGITGSCARCHDHKFDPIPQQDYYSLAGVFNNSSVHDAPLASQEVVDRYNDYRREQDDLKKKKQQLEKKLKKEKREATDDEKAQLEAWAARLEELGKDPPPKYETAHALRDSSNQDMNVAIRGNLRKTGDLAPRRFLRVLSKDEPKRFVEGSGRLELAKTIVDPTNPLTVRVFVNRVWMHHFGQAIVRTPSNFGTLGEMPTHPELLDWLAAEFVESGWSLKSLHRLIMTSSTYQLSSEFRQNAFDADGGNQWLWRMSPRRMDVEAWRDSLLAVTGELDATVGGPAKQDITKDKCRTLYAKVSRNGDVFASDRFLRRFDFPLMRATVAQRPKSIVPQQFLFLLNSSFMVERAKQLVERLEYDTTGGANADRIVRAYELLYSRPPTDVELEIGLEFVSAVPESNELTSWQRYAQVLLSSNEFMYVR